MIALKALLYFNILLLCHGQNTLNISNQNITDPIDEYIERPCEIFDKFCIRQFLAQHSKCKPVDGPVPDPLYRDKTTGYAPHANVTFIPIAVTVSGLNGRIEEFYINRKTDRLLLAVEFTNLYAASPYAYLRYHRRAQEPLVYNDFGSINFTSLVLTITIPNLKDLQLERSEVFAYSPGIPVIILGGRFTAQGVEPEVVRAVADIFANFPITVRELMLNDNPFYIGSYIQYNLCDFGLKLI
ncbi:fibrohexamerin-like [Aricia agestis]|uniref:fibrohexamerin-like n=1 Tax=Aricia agestis TaxID=91739 RepID=UPI001C20B738|nr:fibrohexamerin-like [Aricia agestis]